MKVSQTAIDAAMKAARTALTNYSSFYSGMVPDSALQMVVVDSLRAAFGTVPSPTITGAAAHAPALSTPK